MGDGGWLKEADLDARVAQHKDDADFSALADAYRAVGTLRCGCDAIRIRSYLMTLLESYPAPAKQNPNGRELSLNEPYPLGVWFETKIGEPFTMTKGVRHITGNFYAFDGTYRELCDVLRQPVIQRFGQNREHEMH